MQKSTTNELTILMKRKTSIIRMAKGQKKQKQTPEVLAKLEHAFSIDSTVIEACFFADISETTYHRWCSENEQLRERFKALKSKMVFKARQTVCDNLDDVSTAKWYLERRCKNEFSLNHEVAQTETLELQSEYMKELRKRANQKYFGQEN